MSEDTIRVINFPKLPEDIPDDLREYLIELERVLQSSLKGSMYMDKVLEDGILGN